MRKITPRQVASEQARADLRRLFGDALIRARQLRISGRYLPVRLAARTGTRHLTGKRWAEFLREIDRMYDEEIEKEIRARNS